ncbi:hypothetical protein FPOAC2_03847 [Fusarium poae]|uniref:hypothetical protein n=1 Tax=Fusarium poae TaxID=36050 RepID=UPI001CE7F241|nr:hypothetical protein FPOAC1_003755 [Fusarium poae]KAG8677727.1 hypothetical protein FPOAC1_003755 [Fusarium poae]
MDVNYRGSSLTVRGFISWIPILLLCITGSWYIHVILNEKPSPWMETGYPTQTTEIWRIRVCKLHHQILMRNPKSPPQPLHSVLNLDVTRHPFTLFELSAKSGQPLYSAVRHTIAEAFSNLSSDPEDEGNQDWIYITRSVVGVLLDDQARYWYAKSFVPVLTKGRLEGHNLEDGLMLERVKELERLCA